MSRGKRNFLYFLLFGVIIFIVVTLILSFVYGAGGSHAGFIVLGLTLGGFLVTTTLMVYWVRSDQFDDKLKYLAIAQSLILAALCVSTLIIIYEPKESCAVCNTCATMLGAFQNNQCRYVPACAPGFRLCANATMGLMHD